mgnify:CR=1 FL=1
MMNTDSVITLIGTLGFPIVMCGALCFYIYKVQTKLQEIINDNTKAIEKLVNQLERFMKTK